VAAARNSPGDVAAAKVAAARDVAAAGDAAAARDVAAAGDVAVAGSEPLQGTAAARKSRKVPGPKHDYRLYIHILYYMYIYV